MADPEVVRAPAGQIALVFTDMEQSTALWEADPTAMRDAVAIHHDLLRGLLRERGGYEVKTEGDAFMVAFSDPVAAVRWCLDVQRRLVDAPWPEALLARPEACELRSDGGAVIARGPRVRIGVHVGSPDTALDPTTDRVDYYGPMVNRAARICSAAHGGQTLLSGAAWLLVRDALGADACAAELGEHRLRGLRRSEPLVQLLPAEAAGRRFPPLRVDSLPRTNLEAQDSHFIGRHSDLEAIDRQFGGGARLVTIRGPGGMGKTTLARELGRRIHADTEQPVWFCGLREIDTAIGACRRIAEVLGIPLASDDEVAGIGRSLAARGRLWLVLDNLEQLASVIADAVDGWLDAAPELRVIATSREALRLPRESVHELRPLSLVAADDRDPDPRGDDEALPEAVRLFVHGARRVRPDFALTESDYPIVCEIARRLEGIPLAIDLAAARTKLMSPERILARLSADLDGLGRDAARAMRRSLDASWELLSQPEREALVQCTAFRGGWSLEAAEGVVTGDHVLERIESLVDKSLLRTWTTDTGAVRFEMYETIRAYAADELSDDRRRELDSRHARYYATWSQQQLERRHGAQSVEAVREQVVDLDNLLAVAERACPAIRSDDAIWAATAAVHALEWLGAAGEQRRLLDRALSAAADAPDVLKARLIGLGWLGLGAAVDIQRAVALADRAVTWARAAGDREAEFDALIALTIVCRFTEDNHREQEAVDRMLAIGDELPSPWFRGCAQLNRGLLLLTRGDADDGLVCLEDALALFRRAGERRFELYALGNIAINYLARLDPAGALVRLDAAMALAQRRGFRHMELHMIENRIDALSELGSPEAEHAIRGSRELMRHCGIPGLRLYFELSEGKVAQDAGRLAEARDQFRAIRAEAHRAGRLDLEGIAALRLALACYELGDLDEARGEAGQAVALLKQARDRWHQRLGLAVLGAIEARLGDEAVAERRLATARAGSTSAVAELAGAELALARGDLETARAAREAAADLLARSSIARALARSLDARLPR